MWSGVPALVTGAGGFIGSHLTERLVAAGARVRVFLHYNSRSDPGQLRYVPDAVRREVETVFGDVRDADTVRRVTQGAEVVFHLAALIAIPYSYHSPLDVVQTNVLGTAHVLTAARETGVRRVVHTSTSEVYGTATYVPIDEAHPLQGQSPYSASKIAADMLAESYHRSFGLPVTILRPFNTYGPRQSARAVIPAIVTQALDGDTVRLGATHPTRDFTFVTDVVDGFLRIATADHAVGTVFNLGTGREVAIDDLVQATGRLLGKTLSIVREDQRLRPPASEVERLVAGAGRARDLLGWAPAVSLDQGLAATIDWLRDHRDDYRPGVYAI